MSPHDSTDALSDILRHVRLTSSIFCRAELTGAWGVETRGGDGAAIFHAIVRGSGWVRVDGHPPTAFRSGDLIVLPRGDAHLMCSHLDPAEVPVVPIRRLTQVPGACGLPTVHHGGSGPQTSILCGSFRVADDSMTYLLPLLPRLLHVAGGGTETARWLEHTLHMMASELSGDRPGAGVILDRLADILAVQVLRTFIENPPAEAVGWLAALRDPAVARTLGSIHADPARAWTSDELARAVGMSRSVFFRRFSALVGEPPTAYLTRWRMHLACMALRREQLGIAEVAERVGYASEAAFTRAFRRHVGVTPAVFRRAPAAAAAGAAASN